MHRQIAHNILQYKCEHTLDELYWYIVEKYKTEIWKNKYMMTMVNVFLIQVIIPKISMISQDLFSIC